MKIIIKTLIITTFSAAFAVVIVMIFMAAKLPSPKPQQPKPASHEESDLKLAGFFTSGSFTLLNSYEEAIIKVELARDNTATNIIIYDTYKWTVTDNRKSAKLDNVFDHMHAWAEGWHDAEKAFGCGCKTNKP